MTLLGSVDNERGKHTKEMMTKKEDVKLLMDKVKTSPHNPSITFMGFDTTSEIIFPVLVIKSTEPLNGKIFLS